MTVKELYENIGGNYESALRVLMSDQLIARFIVKFLQDKSCERLLSAQDAHDPAALFESAHAMKGVCANLGLDNLSRQASDIAEQFRPGSTRTMSDAELSERIAAIRSDYERSVESIRRFAGEQ